MGAGFHGGFGNTYGAAAGDAVFKSKPELYFSRRNEQLLALFIKFLSQ